MKRRLFISLSTAALLGLSATGYGTLYIDGHDKDGNIPKSDCLEMMCPGDNWCVEDETLKGYCCPGGNSCRVNGKDISECCEKGKSCKDGICVSDCPEPTKTSCAIEKNAINAKGCIIIKKISCADGEYCAAGVCKKEIPCNVNGKIYHNKETIGECAKCQHGRIIPDFTKISDCVECDLSTQRLVNLEDGSKMSSDGRCCVNGQLQHNPTVCPNPCFSCTGKGCKAKKGKSGYDYNYHVNGKCCATRICCGWSGVDESDCIDP